LSDDMTDPGRAGINLDQSAQQLADAAALSADAAQMLWLESRIQALYLAETEEPVPEEMIALIHGLTGRHAG
jgi:hypothetical protein